MKNFYFIIISFSLFSVAACSKNQGIINNSPVILTDHDVEGKWIITQYADSGVDQTTQFVSITLQFNAGGSFTTSRNDTVISGLWSIQPINGLDKLIINLSSPTKPFTTLDAPWYVQNKSTKTLTLYIQHSNFNETMELQRS